MQVNRLIRALSVLIGLLPWAIAADVPTANSGPGRTNANLGETVLTTRNVAPSTFGKLFTRPVDGQLYTQPLILQNLPVGGKNRDVVFVATMHNSVYAFDANDPQANTPLWQVSLGPAVPSTLWPDYLDIVPEMGVLSTPVIDREQGLLYVVNATMTPSGMAYYLHALDVTTGREMLNGPVKVEGSAPGTGSGSDGTQVAFDAAQHLQRPSLTLFQGMVVLGFGSHADVEPYHGWLFGYSQFTLEKRKTYCSSCNADESSFWQGGRGFAVSADGKSLFAATGNGQFDEAADYGNSVLRLDDQLAVADSFTSAEWQDFNDGDLDLGGAGVLLVPNTDLLIVAGKSGKVYVLHQAALGKLTSNDAQAVQTLDAARYGLFTMAIWPRESDMFLYTRGSGEPLKAWRWDGQQFATTPSSTAPQQPLAADGLTVSANGTAAGSGILWHTHALEFAHPAAGILRAYDAADLSKELWNSEQIPLRDRLGFFSKFTAPTVANGKVYVPTFSNSLVVYGLMSQDVPGIHAVLHGASGALAKLSPGLAIQIVGSNIGPSSQLIARADGQNKLPVAMGGYSVFIDGLPASMLYASPYQINAMVPFGIHTSGTVPVEIRLDGKTISRVDVPATACNPGLFTLSSTGSGPAVVLRSDGDTVSWGNPARDGDPLSLWGTGFCAPSSHQPDGTINPAEAIQLTDVPITVRVGGQDVPILYFGPAPGSAAGIYQINIQLPADSTSSLVSIITVENGGSTTQGNVTLSVQ